MKLVTLPTIAKEETLTIREYINGAMTKASKYYDQQGDTIVIILDKEGTGTSVYSTLDVLETLGLLEITKDNVTRG